MHTIKLSWNSVAHFFREITLKETQEAYQRHTRVFKLKVEQLTLLDNGTFTEDHGCIFYAAGGKVRVLNERGSKSFVA